MKNPMEEKAYLLLEDGSFFEGFTAGAKGTVSGEICFNTGMTGYQEIFTDPSYYGQIMTMSNVHIGNYGSKSKDTESQKVQISGLIVRNFSSHYSRTSADESLQNYLLKNNIIAIHGIDTRAVVQLIRNKGAMNCVISTEHSERNQLQAVLKNTPSMVGLELASKVSITEAYSLGNEGSSYKVAVMDYGIKKSILDQLVLQNFHIKVFPAKASFNDIKLWNPEAYFLSNGPGDPETMDYAIQCASQMISSQKPIFGICLGHQILSLALGVPTYKMHHGHRGSNHPVKNLITGLGEITSQNHGFAIDKEKILQHKDELIVSHINLNDLSIEGFEHKKLPIFCVQYHPEAGPGPHDSRYLFTQFSTRINQIYSK